MYRELSGLNVRLNCLLIDVSILLSPQLQSVLLNIVYTFLSGMVQLQ